MEDPPLLSIRRLSKHFDGLTALEDVDLSVDKGEIVGLIGPNGAGKTTLFDCVVGTLVPDEGEIVFDGEEITTWSADRVELKGLVRAFQEPRVFPNLTVLENLLAARKRRGTLLEAMSNGRNPTELLSRARGFLDFLDLRPLADREAEALSTGQKKLLQIGMSLMPEPELILLDEPTAGVNPSKITDIADIVRSIQERGVTLLLIEHNIDFIMDLSDRIYVLNSGRVIAEGSPGEIQQDERVLEAYLGVEM